MYTHQLIELIKTFSKKEMMWFGKFLKSPFFNNRKKLIKLFSILKRFYPNFESRNLTKENIYKSIYGNKPYNDSTFRNLMSDLAKLAQQYLKQEGVEKKEIDSSFFLTHELANRGLNKLYNDRMFENDYILERHNKVDSDYFINKFKVETDRFYLNLMTKKVLKKPFVVSESVRLINAIVFIMSYFFIETIKHTDTLLKYSRAYNIKKNIECVTELLGIFNIELMISYIRNHSSFNVPVIEVYYNLLKAFVNFEDNSCYRKFKKSLSVYSKYLGATENHFLHGRLIDYCILKKNLGHNLNMDIDTEIFKLYKIFIRNGYYKTSSNPYIPFDLYRNVLINCIAVKKLSFMEEFISTYSKKLIPEYIINIENYSYALLNFEKGLFHKALSYLNKIKIDQFVYKLDMKNLHLKIHYELEQYESAISVIDAYKHFLANNTLISESRRLLHNNFVTYTHKLIQYKLGSKKINLAYLGAKVEKSKNVFDKNWIIEKITEQNVKYRKADDKYRKVVG